MSAPTRIETDLFESAQQYGALTSRSAAQQVNHWARIGRALEFAPGVSQRRIVEVLVGAGHYDDLSDEEQAIVRVEWAERTEARRRSLNFAAEFAAVGRSYAELDEFGVVVVREPGEPTAR